MSGKLIDIIPKISPEGGFVKITDSSPINANNKVTTLLNYLEYEEKKHSIFPEMGGYNSLYNIPYSENPESVVLSLSNKISSFLNFPVEIDHTFDSERNMILNCTISNLPGMIQMNVKNAGGFIKLVNPRYIK